MSRTAIFFAFFLPITLFGNVGYSFEEALADKNFDNEKMTRVKDLWMELGIPTSAESKKAFQKDVAEWFANLENQKRFIKKLQEQVSKGGLDSSPEFVEMVHSLEVALKQWNEAYYCKPNKERKTHIE